ncbi:MAG TPA: NADH-quinone oxidoreductase subunit C [Myxococcales bacterium]|jgi:NADH-quinone oxidoreductase subunit C|nr:NADH-quinone oxidoreductase subunit C [Myxococcales bacterium]
MSQALVDLLREKFPDAVLSSASHRGDEVVAVTREKLVEVIAFLRNDKPDLKLLRDIVAVDMLTYKTEMTGGGSISSNEVSAYSIAHKGTPEPRYYVAYNLYSINKKHSLRIRVDLKSTDLKIPSITSLYKTSDWWERYLFDMFGIVFEGHPNLQRLLMYPEFVGHPLRKDYPVRKRQPLVQEQDFPDLVRGPGPGPGGAGVPMSQTHVGRQNVDPNTYD